MIYKEILENVDKADTLVRYAELQGMFRAILNEYENEKSDCNVTEQEYIHVGYEWDAFKLLAIPMFHGKNREHRFLVRYSEYPVEEGYFTDVYLKFYKIRKEQSQNPFLLSRYYDLLWEHKRNIPDIKPVNIANAACENHLKCASALMDIPERILDFISFLDRAFEFAVKIKNEVLIQDCFKLLKKAITLISGDREPTADCIRRLKRLVILSEVFRNVFEHNNVECLPVDYHRELFDILEDVIGFLYELKVYDDYRYFTREQIKLGSVISWPDEKLKSLNFKIGKSFELQAEEQPGMQKMHLVAVSLYKKAHEHYVAIGASDKAEEMKRKIREENKAAVEAGEYAPIPTEVTFTREELDRHVARYLDQDNIDNSLRIFWSDPNFDINLKEIEDGVRKANKDPLLFFANKVLAEDFNSAFSIEELEEKFAYAVNCDIDIRIKLMMIPLTYIIEKLKEEKKLDADALCGFFGKWQHIKDRHMKMIEVAVRRYFDGDYISATCILVPRIESFLRDFFEDAGTSVTIMKAKKQRYRSFGDFISSDEVKQGLGEGFQRFIQILMVDVPGGMNLRNKVAHGYINAEACTKGLVEILLFILIKTTRYRIKEKNEK